MRQKVSIFHSLLWVFCSAVIINGAAYAGLKGYQYWKRQRNLDYKVPIYAIIQTGPQKEALKTSYLAQLLNLSSDQPQLTSQFDSKRAKHLLLQSPVIKEANVKVLEPGVIMVDYTVRRPLAYLLDYENIALDEEAVPFPVSPFFTPKKLPEIYLGLEDPITWNVPIKGEKMELAFQVLQTLTAPILKDLFPIQRIDVSNAFHTSLGRQEIVLFSNEEIYTTHNQKEVCYIFPHILRLPPKKFTQELSNYLKLRESLLEKEKQQLVALQGNQTQAIAPTKVIDFLIPQLAFVDEGDKD